MLFPIIYLIFGIIIGILISRLLRKKGKIPESVRAFSQAQSKKKQKNPPTPILRFEYKATEGYGGQANPKL